MEFLTGVRIRDFRSIAKADLSPLSDIVPLVGLNGSGKSNLMRALNLFFNEEVEQGQPLDLRRDFREPGRKAKLRVAVEVDLDFDAFDDLRAEFLEALVELTGEMSRITFRKEWTLDPITRSESVQIFAGLNEQALQPLSGEQIGLAVRLLNPIRFRYMPNHVHPSETLRAEQEAIRKVLQDRMGRRGVLSDQDVDKIAEVAADLMSPIRDAMKQATGDVADVQLATPSDWRDLAWAFGLRLQASQTQSFEALLHGSGVQSLLAFEVLHQIDTTFSGSFGWRKGAIWAIEEPESFLHARLQGELAQRFVDYASGEALQIIFSTHSGAFLGTADEGVVVTADELGRSEFAVSDRRDVLRTAFGTGVAPFAHPLHTGPPRPILLVEGVEDRELIARAYAETDFPSPYEILALADFDDALTGGVDQIETWLSSNRPALLARPSSSPVMVLLDWEVNDQSVSRLSRILEVHPTSRCIRWPKDLTNADLSDSWVGIEKFFSTEFIEEMADEADLRLRVPALSQGEDWLYDIARPRLRNAKSYLRRRLNEREDPDDIELLMDATAWLSQQLGDAPTLL